MQGFRVHTVRSSTTRFIVACRARKVRGRSSQSTNVCSFTVSFAYYAEEGKWRITTSCSVHTCGRNLDVGTIVPTRWVASHLAPLIRRDEGGVIKASTVKALLKESLKLTVPDRCAHLLAGARARRPACTCAHLPASRPACVCAHLPAGPRACSFGSGQRGLPRDCACEEAR